MKIGDKVKFYDDIATDTECGCCGHIDTKYEEVILGGKITKKYMDIPMAYTTPVKIDTEELDNGEVIHTPGLATIEVMSEERCYKVDVKGKEYSVFKRSIIK